MNESFSGGWTGGGAKCAGMGGDCKYMQLITKRQILYILLPKTVREFYAF